jgi:hypothetical protein
VSALGPALIRLAVSSAHARGCRTFLANVQSQNVPLFRRLHWTSLEVFDLHGRAHHRMRAELAAYPPFAQAEIGFRSVAEGRVMADAVALSALAETLRASRGLAAKRDIASMTAQLGMSGASAVPVGDDCAAIPDGDSFLLFSIEGFMNEFTTHGPCLPGGAA